MEDDPGGRVDDHRGEEGDSGQDDPLPKSPEVEENDAIMCDLCGFAASSKKLLRTHIQTEHEGLLHKCEQCEYVAKSSGTLRRHQQSVHEGMEGGHKIFS
jgi:hypothetical protein